MDSQYLKTFTEACGTRKTKFQDFIAYTHTHSGTASPSGVSIVEFLWEISRNGLGMLAFKLIIIYFALPTNLSGTRFTNGL